MKKCTHNSTGNIYHIVDDNVIDATTNNSGKRYVLYIGKERTTQENTFFVREYDEFINKFSIE